MDNNKLKSLLHQLREVRAEYDAALIPCQRENAILKVFCLSLLKAHPNPLAALAQLASRAEGVEGRSLFGEWTDIEVEALQPAAQELLEEFSRRLR